MNHAVFGRIQLFDCVGDGHSVTDGPKVGPRAQDIAIRKKERTDFPRRQRERLIVRYALISGNIVDPIHAKRRKAHTVALLDHAGFE